MNEIQLLNYRMKRHLKAKGLSANTVVANQGLKVLSLGSKKPRDKDIFVSDEKESLRDIILRQSEQRAKLRRPSAKYQNLDIHQLPKQKGIMRQKSTFVKNSPLHRKSVQFEDSFMTTNLFSRMQTREESIYSSQNSGIYRSEQAIGGLRLTKNRSDYRSALLPQIRRSSFMSDTSPMSRISEQEKLEEQRKKLKNLVQGIPEKKGRNLIPPLPKSKQRTSITITKYLNHNTSFPSIACVPDASESHYLITKTEPLDQGGKVHEERAAQKPRQFLSEEAQKVLERFKRHERTRSVDFYELERQRTKMKELNQKLALPLRMS